MKLGISPEDWRTLTTAWFIGAWWIGLVCLVRLVASLR
jgi:hypothetical protein